MHQITLKEKQFWKYMEELTKKQKGFVKDFVETDNATQSALNNYDTTDEATAASIGYENLRKPEIINAIKSIADKIPNELLERVHLEGLEATHEGMPDYSVRHKYLDTAYKLKGVYEADEQKKINVFIPVLVKFINKKDERDNNGDTN